MKVNPKSQKGAVTLIMTVTMLFLTAFLMTLYIRLSNNASISAETTSEIAKKYDNIGDMKDIYYSYFTDSNIIPITTKEELAKIGSNESIIINGKIYKFEPNGKYVLMNDIDLGAYDETSDDWDSSKAWDSSTIKLGTDGVLDGLGNTITGLYINNASSEGPEGLFGTLVGTVRNLNIKNSYIKGNQNVGAIAGKNNGTIENCYNSGTIIGTSYVGGIAGDLNNNIKNCKNTGIIRGNSNVTGGYIAAMDDNTNSPIDIWSKTITLTKNYKFISGEDVAVVPKGFKVSAKVDEQTVKTGMVIQDADDNEFVWIPVPKAIITEAEINEIIANHTDEINELIDKYEVLSPESAAVGYLASTTGVLPMAVEEITKDENDNIIARDYVGIIIVDMMRENNKTDYRIARWTYEIERQSFEEPTNIQGAGFEDRADRFTNIVWTEDYYKNLFYRMIHSVDENKRLLFWKI